LIIIVCYIQFLNCCRDRKTAFSAAKNTRNCLALAASKFMHQYHPKQDYIRGNCFVSTPPQNQKAPTSRRGFLPAGRQVAKNLT